MVVVVGWGGGGGRLAMRSFALRCASCESWVLPAAMCALCSAVYCEVRQGSLAPLATISSTLRMIARWWLCTACMPCTMTLVNSS